MCVSELSMKSAKESNDLARRWELGWEQNARLYRLSRISEDEVEEHGGPDGWSVPKPYCSQAWNNNNKKGLDRAVEVIIDWEMFLLYTHAWAKKTVWVLTACVKQETQDWCQHKEMLAVASDTDASPPTLEGLPWVDDPIAVAVEEGGVLLEHAHPAGVAPSRALLVARVHRRHRSREICIPWCQIKLHFLCSVKIYAWE